MIIQPPDPADPDPASEQLRRQLARRAAEGDLAPGTRLPTVRALAAELGLAAGTVARAYRQLEADGIIVTEGRHGTFVAPSPASSAPEALAAAEQYAAAARRLGLSLEEARKLVDRSW